jgi:hypothetical protein
MQAIVVPQEQAMAYETAHRFMPGVGHVYVGAPIPRNPPLNPPDACTPTADIPEGTVVTLRSPRGTFVDFVWLRSKHLLRCRMLGSGNRMAFYPSYLASYGWSR